MQKLLCQSQHDYFLTPQATKWHESDDKNDRKPAAFINNKPSWWTANHFIFRSLFLLTSLGPSLFLVWLFMLQLTRVVIYEHTMSPTTHQTLSQAIVFALTMQLKKCGKKKRNKWRYSVHVTKAREVRHFSSRVSVFRIVRWIFMVVQDTAIR